MAERKENPMSVRRSEQTDQLDEAFARAQAKFGSAKKSTEGQIQNRKYKYADLSEIIPAMLPFLNAEGVSIRQHPGIEWRQIGEELTPFMTVTTRITYKGQWEESDIALPAYQRGVFDAQSCGSALSYACRYGLQGVGVIVREDDDGAAATGRGSHEEAQAVGQAKIEALKASKTQASLFYALQPSGQYAITGDQDLMRKIYKQFKAAFHEDKEGRFYMLGEEQLEVLKFQCEESKIPLIVLKGPAA